MVKGVFQGAEVVVAGGLGLVAANGCSLLRRHHRLPSLGKDGSDGQQGSEVAVTENL